jgi:DNA-binding response OmpR family regulator
VPLTGTSETNSDSSPRGGCVLIVEDDADTLKAMLRLFQINGVPAHGADGYHSALDVYRREHCPVLISDIVLSDGCGLDLMRELKPYGVLGIAVSGRTSLEDRAASRQAGFNAHLHKPIRFTELLEEVRRITPANVT